MKGIFHPDRYYYWEEEPWPSPQEIRNLDPIEDRYYLEHLVQYARGARKKLLMKKLGIAELPEKLANPEDPSDRDYEKYIILEEQVAREPDAEILKEAVYKAPTQMATFAFCRLTSYFYPSPWNDAYSYHNYECGWKEGMTTEDVIAFCREMIPVLMFAGAAEDAADSGSEDAAERQWKGFQPFFAFMNHSYGFKRLDCLDLMMLMTDSDFLFDVCKACNEGDETPHVFPVNKTTCARLA